MNFLVMRYLLFQVLLYFLSKRLQKIHKYKKAKING